MVHRKRNARRLKRVERMLLAGASVSEIARRLGVSRQRASQLVRAAGYIFRKRLERLDASSSCRLLK